MLETIGAGDTVSSATSERSLSAPPITKKVAEIGQILERIRRNQRRDAQGKLESLQARIEIGKELIALKEAAGHGRWTKFRDEAGYDERMAQRLMTLPGSPLADQIRVADPDFASWLPLDVQKLASLAGLSADGLRQGFAAKWPLESASRKDVADAVSAAQLSDRRGCGTIPLKNVPSIPTALDGQVNPSVTGKDKNAPPIPDEKATVNRRGVDHRFFPPVLPTEPSDASLSKPVPTAAFARLLQACNTINEEWTNEVISEMAATVVDHQSAVDILTAVTSTIEKLSRLQNFLKRGANV